jgi:four helix bundle protein
MIRAELENRLIDFAVQVLKISQSLPRTQAGTVLAGQVVRSGTSTALNYGEAQSAESSRDFIHKLQIILKELRETLVCLKIIQRSGFFRQMDTLEKAILENNELIAIFVKSIQTSKRKMQGTV